jgi:hypothetical protein
MLESRVVRLIETNADHLAGSLVDRLLEHDKLEEIRRVPREKLLVRAYEVYSDLSDWLMTKLSTDIEKLYLAIGALRARQGYAFSTVAGANMVMKEHLFDFYKQPFPGEEPLEPVHKVELMDRTSQFFDRAVFFAARGYERSQVNEALARQILVPRMH